MRLIPILISCCFATPVMAAAVDIFAVPPDDTPSDETATTAGAAAESPTTLPPDRQAALYRELFAAEEAAAGSSRKELELARHLITRAPEERYAPIRPHLYLRARELAEGHRRKPEGLEVLLAVHRALHADAAYDRELIGERIALITNLLRKVRGSEAMPLVSELQQLIGEQAVNALAERDYKQAGEDYGALARIMAQTGDREGALALKALVRAIEDAADDAEAIAKLRPLVAKDPAAALEVGRYDLAQGDDEAALAALTQAGDEGRALAEVALAALALSEGSAPDLSDLEQVATALDQERRSGHTLRRRLLTIGLALRDRLTVGDNRVTALRAAALGEGWEAQAEALGPNPLQAVSLAGGVSEAQLLRAGWIAAFDHQNVPGGKEAPGVRVRPDGVLEIAAVGGAHSLRAFEGLGPRRELLVRFRITENEGWSMLIFGLHGADRDDVFRVGSRARNEIIGASRAYGSELGAVPWAKDGGWNEVVWSIDGATVSATINGQPTEAVTLKQAPGELAIFVNGTSTGRLRVEIQSMLYRE